MQIVFSKHDFHDMHNFCVAKQMQIESRTCQACLGNYAEISCQREQSQTCLGYAECSRYSTKLNAALLMQSKCKSRAELLKFPSFYTVEYSVLATGGVGVSPAPPVRRLLKCGGRRFFGKRRNYASIDICQFLIAELLLPVGFYRV